MKYSGIGRRKSAIAKILFSEIIEVTTNDNEEIDNEEIDNKKIDYKEIDYEKIFSENIFINNKKIDDYFQNDLNVLQNIQQVFKIFKLNKHQPLNMQITVSGGGKTGQKEAICLAIARALSKRGLFPLQKKPNLLTQDTRKKERKKYGLKKARKAPQYSKR